VGRPALAGVRGRWLRLHPRGSVRAARRGAPAGDPRCPRQHQALGPATGASAAHGILKKFDKAEAQLSIPSF